MLSQTQQFPTPVGTGNPAATTPAGGGGVIAYPIPPSTVTPNNLTSPSKGLMSTPIPRNTLIPDPIPPFRPKSSNQTPPIDPSSHIPEPNVPLLPTTSHKTPDTRRYDIKHDFALKRTVGTGTFGRVHLAESVTNGLAYAIKVLNKDKVIQLKQVAHTRSERRVLALISAPHSLLCQQPNPSNGSSIDPTSPVPSNPQTLGLSTSNAPLSSNTAPGSTTSTISFEEIKNYRSTASHPLNRKRPPESRGHPFFVTLWGTLQDDERVFMVLDWVGGGELFGLIRRSRRFPDAVAKFYAAEVACGIDFLHGLGIIYRDLKPENILIDRAGHVKITDFGFAKEVEVDTWTLCGTPDYLAPEIVRGVRYNKSVDMWSLGVLIFEMIAGYPPFHTEDNNPLRLYEKILSNRIHFTHYFTHLSQDIVRRFLESDCTKRLGNLSGGWQDVFNHPWFAEVDWIALWRKELPVPWRPSDKEEHFDKYDELDVSAYGRCSTKWKHGDTFAGF